MQSTKQKRHTPSAALVGCGWLHSWLRFACPHLNTMHCVHFVPRRTTRPGPKRGGVGWGVPSSVTLSVRRECSRAPQNRATPPRDALPILQHGCHPFIPSPLSSQPVHPGRRGAYVMPRGRSLYNPPRLRGPLSPSPSLAQSSLGVGCDESDDVDAVGFRVLAILGEGRLEPLREGQRRREAEEVALEAPEVDAQRRVRRDLARE